MLNQISSAVMGLCVGDSLGVPVEFMNREELVKDPVIDMRSYGTYNQPAGTWSDDTSLTLCLLDSLAKGLDYNDIMQNFMKWYKDGDYTPFGQAFDIGVGTRNALRRFEAGTSPLECGGKREYDNGNGSLMRILPITFYLQSIYGTEFYEVDHAFEIIHNVSSLTHGHKRSQMACGIYITIAGMLVGKMDLKRAVQNGIDYAMDYYRLNYDFADELMHFKGLEKEAFSSLERDKISSSGYVVSTLEAAIWCLLNTTNYKDCVLKAVNLGEDTDTVAAVAGGLAGLYYGYETIPKEWLNTIVKRSYIEEMCEKLNISTNRASIEKLCAYIPYFQTTRGRSACKWSDSENLKDNCYSRSYPIYDKTLEGFVQEFYKTNLICYDYLDVIEKRGISNIDEMNDLIRDADLKLLGAILTYYIRQERFEDGLWEEAVKNGAFLSILNRYCEIK